MDRDFVSHSATRYSCGHFDVLTDIVVAKIKELARPLHGMMVHIGATAGLVDCWLALYDTRTSTLCMSAHCQNILEIARCLEVHPVTEKVFYPGLPSRKYYELAKT